MSRPSAFPGAAKRTAAMSANPVAIILIVARRIRGSSSKGALGMLRTHGWPRRRHKQADEAAPPHAGTLRPRTTTYHNFDAEWRGPVRYIAMLHFRVVKVGLPAMSALGPLSS
jgi:hypothetical protein